jgi:antitoxin component YwqK of YwqJK toxin-antitoxin module
MNRILLLIGVILVVGCGPPRDGPWEWYHENGQLSQKRTFKDGKLDGPFERYYENGQLERKGTFEDEERDGPWEWYHENGQLREKRTYKDGKQCGEWLEFGGETVTYPPCSEI